MTVVLYFLAGIACGGLAAAVLLGFVLMLDGEGDDAE